MPFIVEILAEAAVSGLVLALHPFIHVIGNWERPSRVYMVLVAHIISRVGEGKTRIEDLLWVLFMPEMINWWCLSDDKGATICE